MNIRLNIERIRETSPHLANTIEKAVESRDLKGLANECDAHATRYLDDLPILTNYITLANKLRKICE